MRNDSIKVNYGKRRLAEVSEQIPLWIIVLVVVLLAVGIGGHEPWTPDEPREVGIALTMARSGKWLIPELGEKPFVEKPPLYYWVSALMMRSLGLIVGPTTAARAVSACCAALTLLTVWLVVKNFWGRFRGGAVFLILGTSFGFVRAGHWIIIDPLLMLLITVAVLLFFLGLERDRSWAILVAFLAAGLAFLTKGFVAWNLLFLPWALLGFLYYKSIVRNLRIHLTGLLLLLGPPIVWMILFYFQGGPELWREWFIDNQIGRFTGGSTHLGHLKGPFYYFWLVPVTLLPWTPLIIDWFIRRVWRCKEFKASEGSRNLLLLAVFWGMGGMFLLSLASTKREVYFYPLIPAFAILMASGFKTISRWCRVGLLVIAIIFFVPIPVFAFLNLDWNGNDVIFKFGFNFLIAIAAGVGIFSLYRLKARPVMRTAALASVFYISVSLVAFPILDKVWSYKPMTVTLTSAIPETMRNRVCLWGNDETTQGVFSYYSNIMLPMVEEPERISRILSGNDPDFDLIVIPRLEEFKEKNPDAPGWKVLEKAKKGRRRVFYLIGGEFGV